jgi:hypothetical protein
MVAADFFARPINLQVDDVSTINAVIFISSPYNLQMQQIKYPS